VTLGRSRFIVIEGLIGVGKTSLCRILEGEWGARLVLEPWDDNPFLAAFYADRERYAFPTQMFYLASRFAQQQNLVQTDLFNGLIVSDYLYAKDRLFAEETLRGEELELYDKFAQLLAGPIPRPDVVVFLDAPTEVIRSRITRRGIAAEQVITADYLDSLRDRYYALWSRFDAAPVYVVDTTHLDYVSDMADRAFMLSLIQGWLEGRAHPRAPRPYVPGAEQRSQLPLFAEAGLHAP
jgi:deoxyadenosine/deoxycytidine kinase